MLRRRAVVRGTVLAEEAEGVDERPKTAGEGLEGGLEGFVAFGKEKLREGFDLVPPGIPTQEL